MFNFPDMAENCSLLLNVASFMLIGNIVINCLRYSGGDRLSSLIFISKLPQLNNVNNSKKEKHDFVFVKSNKSGMYSFKSKVRYSECDKKSNMTLSALVNYLQDCGTFQSESLGIGEKYREDNRVAWVLSYWHIIIERFPKLGEEICISTWAYRFARFTAYRNFTIKDKYEQVIAYANSLWVYIDAETGKLKRVNEEQKLLYSTEPGYLMEGISRKIKIPSKIKAKEAFKIPRFCIDSNQHVNNEKYILMAMEYLPDNSRVKSVRVEYKSAAVLGDMIYPYVGVEGNKVTVLLGNEEMKLFAVVQFLVKKSC